MTCAEIGLTTGSDHVGLVAKQHPTYIHTYIHTYMYPECEVEWVKVIVGWDSMLLGVTSNKYVKLLLIFTMLLFPWQQGQYFMVGACLSHVTGSLLM